MQIYTKVTLETVLIDLIVVIVISAAQSTGLRVDHYLAVLAVL